MWVLRFRERLIALRLLLLLLLSLLLSFLYLEKAMAPHSSTFAQKIPWMGEPGRLHSMGSLESDMTEQLHFHFSLSCTGEGNGNPLQRSCLENPGYGGAWWAAVSGVAQSRTRLKRLKSCSSSFLYHSQTLIANVFICRNCFQLSFLFQLSP